MFQIFLNFAKYVSILLCTGITLRSCEGTETTTISIDQEVEQNLAPLQNILNKIMDTNTDTNTKLELKGRILGNLEDILKYGIKADREVKQLWKREENLEMQINDADKFRLVLGLTYRIDCLESMLAPGTSFEGVQRSKRWSTIFGLGTPATEKFKKKVDDAGMTTIAFAKCIERLCSECNTRAGYARIPLPDIVKEKTIEGALAIMEITDDDDKPFVEAVKIIVAPV